MDQMPQQQPQTAGLPDMQEYKKQQTGILATMIPQIMNAMGGGDPYVQRALQQQQQQYENRIMQNNLRGFMRTVSMPATGEITPELIMEQAQAWDVPADMAMQAIMQFQQFRKANQAEKQKFSRMLPGGGVNTFEALPTDPMAQGEGVFPGEISGMPGPPALTESYNPDGTATIVPKVAGATINPKPDRNKLVQIDTGDGWKRFVTPQEGMEYRENPSPESQDKQQQQLRQVKKDLDIIESRIYSAQSREGLISMLSQNPAMAAIFTEQFGTPDSEKARLAYLDYLGKRRAELMEKAGMPVEKPEPEEKQADFVWDSETMTFKENK